MYKLPRAPPFYECQIQGLSQILLIPQSRSFTVQGLSMTTMRKDLEIWCWALWSLADHLQKAQERTPGVGPGMQGHGVSLITELPWKMFSLHRSVSSIHFPLMCLVSFPLTKAQYFTYEFGCFLGPKIEGQSFFNKAATQNFGRYVRTGKKPWYNLQMMSNAQT